MRIGPGNCSFNKHPVDPAIKAQLDALGLKPTGSREGDLAAIKEAMDKNTESTGLNFSPQQGMMPPPQTPPAVAEFMKSIGLQPTNSKEGDMAAVLSKLNTMEASVKNQVDLVEVKVLRSVWAELTSSASSGGSSFQGQSTSDSFAGQDQVARMNRWFFLKNR